MGRMYRTEFTAVGVTVAQDLFEILAATAKHCIIHAWGVSQTTEVGDAQEEGLQILIKRGVGATSGSGGSTHTPAPTHTSDTAAGAVVEINNTTKMTSGTITQEENYNWNVRQRIDIWYTPETRLQIAPGERKTIELNTAPADSITMSGYVIFEELG